MNERMNEYYNNPREVLLNFSVCIHHTSSGDLANWRLWLCKSRMGPEVLHFYQGLRMLNAGSKDLRKTLWSHSTHAEISSPILIILISFHGHFIESLLAPIQNSRKITKIVYGTKRLCSLQSLYTLPFLCLRLFAASITSSSSIYF